VDTDKLLELLHAQVVPAVGCTEPVSIAIAVATAKNLVNGPIKNVLVQVSLSILKNGMRVGIPGTREKGIPFATALALVNGNPELGLEIFKDVDDQAVQQAQALLDAQIIHIETTKNANSFYVYVQIISDSDTAECIIESNHTNIVSIKKNGVELNGHGEAVSVSNTESAYEISSFDAIFDFAETVDPKLLKFLLEGVSMNLAIANAGKATSYSSGLGPRLFKLMDQGSLPKDISNLIKAYTACASDARMGGLNYPVMSSSGSGNQGIAAIVPIAILGQHLNSTEDQIVTALAISHLVTHYIKQKTGRLSPVCGCAVAAGIGAAAGMTWLQGGRREEMLLAINNMVGSLAGMVCDGAKGGCSYKLATAVGEAYIQSLVVLDQTSVSQLDGIVGMNTEETVTNLGELCKTGMTNVDTTLVNILNTYN